MMKFNNNRSEVVQSEMNRDKYTLKYDVNICEFGVISETCEKKDTKKCVVDDILKINVQDYFRFR